MQKPEYRVVTEEDRDHMPAEVALELLTTPKAKVSNRMRKTCREARDAVFVSEFPIEHEYEDGRMTGKYFYRQDLGVKPMAVKLQNRFGHVTAERLQRTVARMTRRANFALRASLKASVPAIKERLQQLHIRFMMVVAAATSELDRRKKQMDDIRLERELLAEA